MADEKQKAPCVLGIRVQPKETAWALVSGTQDAPVLEEHGKLLPPKVLKEEAERLAWYWDQANLLIGQHAPQVVAVRYAEQFGASGKREPDRARARIEGVIIAAATKRGVSVFTGALKAIAVELETKASKKYLDQNDLRGLDWSSLDHERREAVLVATAALSQL